MIPLLLCAYKPRYLAVVLKWFQQNRVDEHFTIMAWDNGGAMSICEKFGVTCFSARESQTGPVVNLGKAAGFHYLMDMALQKVPQATCYICMDDDVIIDLPHLQTLVATAQRPGFGMIGARYHPFNTLVRPGANLVAIDPCPHCAGQTPANAGQPCGHCRGTGKDPNGLWLRTYPREDRLIHKLGCVGGAIFAIARDTINRLDCAPYLYPIKCEPGSNRPLTYWGEDALLDFTLTALGFVNGYVEHPGLQPVIHLPELDPEYNRWKADVKYKGIYGPMPNPFK